MGKLDEAIAGQSGFPRVMPGLEQPLTVPQKIACAARILDAEGYALDVAGHITVVRDDADDGSMWCTPYGLWWNEVTASDILMIDSDGEVLEGRWDVTPAVFIHTEMHRARPDARVVIHNHPYYGSLLSTMHKLPEITDQQACMFDGDIALFGTYTGGVDDAAGGQEMADAVGQRHRGDPGQPRGAHRRGDHRAGRLPGLQLRAGVPPQLRRHADRPNPGAGAPRTAPHPQGGRQQPSHGGEVLLGGGGSAPAARGPRSAELSGNRP